MPERRNDIDIVSDIVKDIVLATNFYRDPKEERRTLIRAQEYPGLRYGSVVKTPTTRGNRVSERDPQGHAVNLVETGFMDQNTN
jgi:hypothetical protein